MENRELIARAIFDDDAQWDRFPPEYRQKYLQSADRVIRASVEPRLQQMREALTDAREAIASLDDDALGMVVVAPRGDDDFGHEYPVRDELLAKIDEALRVTGVGR